MTRRGFLGGSAVAFAAVGALGARAATHDSKPPTRVLDHRDIQHGKVMFTHNGKETFGGYLARPRREAMLFAARSREVDAVVAFHPAPMTEAQVVRLTIPVQVHHGTADESVPHKHTQALEVMLRKGGTPVEVFLYDKLNHGFLAQSSEWG